MEFIQLDNLFASTIAQIAITILLAIIVQLLSREMLRQVVKHAVVSRRYAKKEDEKKREDTLVGVLHAASAVAIWVIVVVAILYELHVNVSALLAGAGLIGIVVGFGTQAAVKDYLAGFFVVLENQYRVGDIVMFYADGANVSGVVEGISLRVTKLRDLDGNVHLVQNGSAGTVTNMSFEFANVNIDIGIGYQDDLDKAQEVINRVGLEQAADEKWKEAIIEPVQFYRLDHFSDSAVVLKALGKSQPAMQWSLAGDFRLRIKKAFDKAGIDLPVAQVVVRKPKQ